VTHSGITWRCHARVYPAVTTTGRLNGPLLPRTVSIRFPIRDVGGDRRTTPLERHAFSDADPPLAESEGIMKGPICSPPVLLPCILRCNPDRSATTEGERPAVKTARGGTWTAPCGSGDLSISADRHRAKKEAALAERPKSGRKRPRRAATPHGYTRCCAAQFSCELTKPRPV